MEKKAICPNCDAELEQDECYDTRSENEYIVNLIAGHCPTCEKNFQWEEVYNYAGVDELEEVS
jgi:endogenous inhibitor of DNA gyrase (YacG/DUF329 family)